ncbi:MAG: hypothetical protein WC400_02630, partial [Patescibacteria group bacterium]
MHVIETSYGNPSPESYPESVEVLVSKDGSIWDSLGVQMRGSVTPGDNDFDLASGDLQLDWAKYVKLIDRTDSGFKGFPREADGYDVAAVKALHSAPKECEISNAATLHGYTEQQFAIEAMDVDTNDDKLSVTSEPMVITLNEFACQPEEPEEPVVTIIAHKIICDSEELLPNWGTGEYAPITATTAQEFVDSHKGCRFADDWQFEWAPEGTANPGDALIGHAEGWNSSDLTVDGMTTITLTDEELGDNSYVWIREVLPEGYVPFSGWTSNGSNVPTEEEAFSAELYATTDVLNYDNYDRVEADGGLQIGETYYAVAFNVATEEEPEEPGSDTPGTITGMKFNDVDGNGAKDDNDSGLEGWTIYAGKFVQEFDVDSHNDDPLWHEDSNNDGKSVFSDPLDDQAEYIIRATGTFDANDGITADAQYSKRLFADDPEAWTDTVDGYGGYGERLLDLWIGSAYGLWGDFSPSHVYWHTFVGNGNQAEFHIHDICAENNSGSLHVEIYKVVAKDVTDGNGEYQLDIPAEINGDLVVAEEAKTDWVQTHPDPSVKDYYTVSADVVTEDIDFGNHDITIPEPTGSISGIKWNDHDSDGNKDSDDEVLSNWTIYLDANDNGALDGGEKSFVTLGDGSYTFSDLDAATYIVREVGQSGWTQTHPVAPTGGPAAYSLLVGSGDGAQWNWTDIDFGN